MNRKHGLLLLTAACIFASCKKDHDDDFYVPEDPATFAEIGTIDIGDVGAAEISAYDPQTKRLFVVNNGQEGKDNKIDIIDFADPTKPKDIGDISTAPYGGYVNSVSVSNGLLAAAIESINKQEPGKVVVFNTANNAEVKSITVGALPDMLTFSPDGKYILSANEGEPSADYTNDPAGTVSIISVKDNYAVTTLDFSAFAGQQAALQAQGLRVFGLNATFAKDMEPEYITIAADSKTAWVTLQENNAIAKIDIASKAITAIYPLGFKNYNEEANAIDASDKDNTIAFKKWKVKGMYQPDAIAVYNTGGIPYLFTVNEGDVREYTAFNEAKRVGSLTLDPTAFPDATTLKLQENLGRLNVTTTLGDTDKDGDYDELYSFGARSFSVWNGNSGTLVFDSKNDLDARTKTANLYDDGRSDDKGAEPEGIALGEVGKKKLAFVGLERADAVAIYDVTNPAAPQFLQLLSTGDAPEGVLFISAKDSPIQQSLVVVSSENDGVIKVYKPKKI
ncbi:choice-of-anchor I family protein [Paraflavitalea sp. CAU 1676]|uniref:choice-of-anchor I family protein n=1 Tax=Paraflavitalea sp. CAU 1676 TaxID=3032598 RepID=UPI0023DA59E7|nr:choice-of-anchor I family protein [Paraflavitalea sp. CAU 1676]MDF2191184.1 choice-of-anchor I family protein [Paraflavitalea sp. CAU 1676]